MDIEWLSTANGVDDVGAVPEVDVHDNASNGGKAQSVDEGESRAEERRALGSVCDRIERPSGCKDFGDVVVGASVIVHVCCHHG